MVRLVLVRAVPASANEIAGAYRRSLETRAAARDREVTTEVLDNTPERLRFVSRGQARAGGVRVDGIVRWESPTEWNCRRDVEVNERPYSFEIERFHVAARDGGSDLTVDCEIHARIALHEMLLGFGRRRLLVQRAQELDRWLPTLASPSGGE
jgi:hypothetical protein